METFKIGEKRKQKQKEMLARFEMTDQTELLSCFIGLLSKLLNPARWGVDLVCQHTSQRKEDANQTNFLIKSLILAQDERWRRA